MARGCEARTERRISQILTSFSMHELLLSGNILPCSFVPHVSHTVPTFVAADVFVQAGRHDHPLSFGSHWFM